MTAAFLHAIPAAIQKHFTDWAQQKSVDLAGFLPTIVSPENAKTILSLVDRIRDTETDLKNSGLPPRVWAGERLINVAPEILEDGPLGDLRNYEPTELGSHIIDLGLAGLSDFNAPVVEQAIAAVTDAGGEHGLGFVTDFFQSALGASQERNVVAIAAASALSAAHAHNVKADPIPLTGAVFLGLRAAKISYQLAAGLLDNDAVFQALEETVAIAAVAVADHIADQLPNAGQAIGIAIAPLLGPFASVAPIAGRTVGEFAKPIVRTVARAAARPLAKIIVQKTRKTAVAAFKTLKSALAL